MAKIRVLNIPDGPSDTNEFLEDDAHVIWKTNKRGYSFAHANELEDREGTKYIKVKRGNYILGLYRLGESESDEEGGYQIHLHEVLKNDPPEKRTGKLAAKYGYEEEIPPVIFDNLLKRLNEQLG